MSISLKLFLHIQKHTDNDTISKLENSLFLINQSAYYEKDCYKMDDRSKHQNTHKQRQKQKAAELSHPKDTFE